MNSSQLEKPAAKTRVANMVQHFKTQLIKIEGPGCKTLLHAVGYDVSKSGVWTKSIKTQAADDIVIMNEGDKISAKTVDGLFAGYALVSWLLFRSDRGINYVKLGALVLHGYKDLSAFESTLGYKGDEKNRGHRVMSLVKQIIEQSDINNGPNETDSVVTAFRLNSHDLEENVAPQANTGKLMPFSPAVLAIETGEADPKNRLAVPAASNNIEPDSEVEVPALPAESADASGALSDSNDPSIDLLSYTTAQSLDDTGLRLDVPVCVTAIPKTDLAVPNFGSDIETPTTSKKYQEILDAFNSPVAQATVLVNNLKRCAHTQFVNRLRLGRFLAAEELRLNDSREFRKLKRRVFPKNDWDDREISNCLYLGKFASLIKTARGGEIKEEDVRLIHKKPMYTIGAYKGPRIKDIVSEVIELVDKGYVVTEGRVKSLIADIKKTDGSADSELAFPERPSSANDILNLPDHCLQANAKKEKGAFKTVVEFLRDAPGGSEGALIAALLKLHTTFR